MIFVPETAPQAKVAQLLIFGATVILVRGTYDQAFDLSLEASRLYGWYSRSTAYNPYMSEGKKTAALEICEQLNWRPPTHIFVGVGDGCIIGGLGKGLRDLLALGLIERAPRLMGVQAEGSRVLYEAWRSGTEEIAPVVPATAGRQHRRGRAPRPDQGPPRRARHRRRVSHRHRRGDPGGDAHPGPPDGRLCRAGRRGAAGRAAQDARRGPPESARTGSWSWSPATASRTSAAPSRRPARRITSIPTWAISSGWWNGWGSKIVDRYEGL